MEAKFQQTRFSRHAWSIVFAPISCVIFCLAQDLGVCTWLQHRGKGLVLHHLGPPEPGTESEENEYSIDVSDQVLHPFLWVPRN